LLADHALASYARAVATARQIDAEERAERARTTRARAEEKRAADEKSRAEIDREADALEAQIAVRRGAVSPVAVGPADGAREQARWAVVRADLAMAEGMCRGAELLSSTARGLDDAKRALAVVTAKASDAKSAAPIDGSTRARALCLGALTAARDVVVSSGGVDGATAASELEKAGLSPTHDERGTVVTLDFATGDRAPFATKSEVLTPSGKRSLAAIATVATAHPHLALVVVAHDAAASPAARAEPASKLGDARAKAAKEALIAAGVPASRVVASSAGGAQPSHDTHDAKARALNERLEIVIVGTAP
jgi:outer membrane protein OmpA-like peptidoglycan-associated protein